MNQVAQFSSLQDENLMQKITKIALLKQSLRNAILTIFEQVGILDQVAYRLHCYSFAPGAYNTTTTCIQAATIFSLW
jgi:hypothetical protein